MDAKEAIEEFNKYKSVGFNNYAQPSGMAVMLAFEALEKVETLEAENARLREKETPKEPRYVKEGDAYCPICGDNVNEWLGDEFISYKFCPDCGQAIKEE